MQTVTLTDAGSKQIAGNRLSLDFRSIRQPETGIDSGELVRILSSEGEFRGLGYYNGASQIPLRILTFAEEPIELEFFKRKIEAAWEFRTPSFFREDSFRLIYGESDGIPGLTADWFSGTLCIQITTAGIERCSEMIIQAFTEVMHPEAIILANDSLSRKKEGLELYRKQISGHENWPMLARIDGIEHYIDPLGGHKTGFFLDHRANRAFGSSYCMGKNVLDVFCYSGAFAIRAALAGAAHVDAIDIFDPAIQLGIKTAQHHKLGERVEFHRREAFQALAEGAGAKSWDVIFLDPPSFVRGGGRARRNTSNYKKINRLALECCSKNGILITSICSFHVGIVEFQNILGEAMRESGREGRIFYMGHAGCDHPVRPGMPELDYLKCAFIRLVD